MSISYYYQSIKNSNEIIRHYATGEVVNLNWDEETTCHDNIKPNCGKGDVSKPASMLMLGDSHAGQLNEFMDYVGKKENWHADVISADHCRFFILADNAYPGFHGKCQPIYEYAKKNWQNYDIIIYAMYWYTAEKIPNFYQTLDQEMRLLTSQGKKVYLIKDNPAINLVPLRMLRQKELGIHWYANVRTRANENVSNDKVEAIANKYPNVYWIDIPKYIPNDLMLDGYPVYQDRDHLNPYGAKQLGIEYVKHEKFLR